MRNDITEGTLGGLGVSADTLLYWGVRNTYLDSLTQPNASKERAYTVAAEYSAV